MIVLIDDAERLVNRWESGGSHSYACAPPPLPHTRAHPNTHSRQCFWGFFTLGRMTCPHKLVNKRMGAPSG